MKDFYLVEEELNKIFSKHSKKVGNFLSKKKSIREFAEKNNVLKKDSVEAMKQLGIDFAKETYKNIKDAKSKNLAKKELFSIKSFSDKFRYEVKKQNYSSVDNRFLRAAVSAVMVTLLIVFLQAYLSTIIYLIFQTITPFSASTGTVLTKSLAYIISLPISIIMNPLIEEFYAKRAEEKGYSTQFVTTMTVADTIRYVFTSMSSVIIETLPTSVNIIRTALTTMVILITRVINFMLHKSGKIIGFEKESYLLAVVINFIHTKLIPIVLALKS